MMDENVEHLLTVLFAVARGNSDAQYDLFAIVVQPRIENEFGVALRLVDGPAGEAARYFDDVLLRVAAVHAERVQLHQFTAVVFVQAAAGLFAVAASRAG